MILFRAIFRILYRLITLQHTATMKLSTAAVSVLLGAAAMMYSQTTTTAIGATPAGRGPGYRIQSRQVTTSIAAAPAPAGRGSGYQIKPRELQDEIDNEFDRRTITIPDGRGSGCQHRQLTPDGRGSGYQRRAEEVGEQGDDYQRRQLAPDGRGSGYQR